jgi:putative tryptophan/tyrosine transport system substrate-binding protein
MKRREFISLLGGAAAWPIAVRAQQPDGMRRIGVLMTALESDSEYQTYISNLRKELQNLGWSEGRNLRIDYRWGALNADLR